MKIHELKIAGTKDRKRVGRGIGSGYGKTAGRGTKGQNSRSGGGVRLGFEGGQNPLAKRLPKKRGFAALNHVDYQIVSLGQLETLKASVHITPEALYSAKLVRSITKPIKVLANGELTRKLTVTLHGATATAEAAIVKAGGTFEKITLVKSPKKPSKRNQEA